MKRKIPNEVKIKTWLKKHGHDKIKADKLDMSSKENIKEALTNLHKR